ncbi:hypothetical protein MSG28_003537 [Choristoneura fumiferana]|uniref:Uncharacterized protein n=1 Tax=Choristoneura fumiferana TaxID=7141 RepID=A0ACC0KFH8_CHOFU|nr:hypothetical protein MSG28_003537 [Choristoneura fumiferana]
MDLNGFTPKLKSTYFCFVGVLMWGWLRARGYWVGVRSAGGGRGGEHVPRAHVVPRASVVPARMNNCVRSE